ncbi:MAG: hypothetical protein C0436_00535 [Alphaproteobacteria bacterium]|nr:hypothetical protein [Alphaproteobacteria bacterium]
MTRFPGFIGGSYLLRSVNADCQRTVNMYPEINEQKTAPNGEVGSLVSTPGLRKLATIGTGPIRCVYRVPISGNLAVVSGNGLYQVDSSWNATLKGTLNTSTGPVDITSNAYQLCIVDGSFGYGFDATATPNFFVISGFPPADRVDFLDGYVLFNQRSTGQFGFTNLNDVSIVDPLDFQTVEGSPDNLVGLVVSNRQIWLPGTDSTEVFVNVGDLNNPFQRVQGTFIEFGCASPFAMQKLGNTVVWLGGGTNGAGIVWMAQGYQPSRVSTHAIELAIQEAGDLSNARAWTYQQDGHQFYCLNIGTNTTWCYDIMTGLWHERINFRNGQELRHRADCHAFVYDTHVVGDYENGDIYALDPEQYTDDGDVIIRERTSPHVTDDNVRIFWDMMQIEAETGVGLDGTQQGTDPQIMMQWSTDAGHTWTPERWVTLGKIGSYLTRAIWRRLGFSRSRVVRVRFSDPVKFTLLGASIQVRRGAN